MTLKPYVVEARLLKRFIFNFRLRPDVLASHLPVSFLSPQIINGWSVVSFCLLTLDQVTLAPLPPWMSVRTICCAYRCGVIDTSGAQSKPSVYVLKRYTDQTLISLLGPVIFGSSIPTIRFSHTEEQAQKKIEIHHDDRHCVFAASIQPSASANILGSEAFDSLDEFTHFLHTGVTSYTPACDRNSLAKIDLEKSESTYTALNAAVTHNSLQALWPEAELVFDSAVQTSGGLYRWTYQGAFQ